MTNAALDSSLNHPPVRASFVAAVPAAIIADITNSLIRFAAGTDSTVSGMTDGAVLAPAAAGVSVGALGWWLFLRLARSTIALSILVPVVYVASLAPL